MPNYFNMRAMRSLSSLLLLLLMGEQSCSAENRKLSLDDLGKGQIVSGFRTEALYINDAEKPFGARFKHEKTGFIFDLLQIQSVPQAFIWVNTLVSSDSGVAHTQEHLLLGKGNKGRNHGTQVQMSLASESAGTAQWRTFYHFNTNAGNEVFYKLLEQYLDLLLHPDYTDEEIRREVRNFAVKEDSKTKSLLLEEKGTVYNEMQSNVHDPNRILWFAAMKTLYGKEHPLSYNSGGTPEGIRGLKPAEIRRFHAKNYVLPNMGMIGAFPKDMAISDILTRTNNMLNQLQKQPVAFQSRRNSERPLFPAPKPMPEGSIQIVSFPEKNAQKPGCVDLNWPPRLRLQSKEILLLGLFLNNLAGDADTPLYKLFVDSKTLKIESGATAVSGWVSRDKGYPVSITLADVAQEHINKKDISLYRLKILSEIERIASWKDGSDELAGFNKKMQYRLAQSKRYYADFVNKPPSFGSRSNSGFLMNQLLMLDEKGGFRRSVTLKPEFAQIEKLLQSKANIWRNYLANWHLLDTVPYVIATRPDASLLSKEESEKKARLEAECTRLMNVYKAPDIQETLRRYKADYDSKTGKLEDLARQSASSAKLVDSLPLTFDDKLDYKISRLKGDIPLVSSVFESMTSAQTVIWLRLDSLPEEDLFYLSLLPTLMRETGVIENGKAVSYEQMIERLGQEIYYLNASFASNPNSNRYELKIAASGTSESESRRSLDWMKLILAHPNWRMDNLHRIRDVVEQSLSALRHTRDSAYEENWDYGVSASYRRQDNPLLLNTQSFLTMTHNIQRLRWLLKGDAEPASVKAFVEFLNLMADSAAKSQRASLKALLNQLTKLAAPQVSSGQELSTLAEAYARLTPAARALVADAADDLSQDLSDIPDDSLTKDWAVLCREITRDVQVAPAQTLAKLETIRQSLLLKGGARLAVVGSASTLNALKEPIEKLAAGLSDKPFQKSVYSTEARIFARLKNRLSDKESWQVPIFSALVNANTHQGIVINTAPAIKYGDTDDESLKGALALNLYGGAGAHGLFMKTWGAGLAYGNGPSWSCNSRIMYYADKMPSIPETLRFVAAELKKAKPDPALADYVVAQCFDSRADEAFERRGEALADDLADNVPPEAVRNFRSAVLRLHSKSGLIDDLYASMLQQYGKVIPGLGVKASAVAQASYLAIGDEKQLALYEDYLKSIESPSTRLYRLFGRDFWINAPDLP